MLLNIKFKFEKKLKLSVLGTESLILQIQSLVKLYTIKIQPFIFQIGWYAKLA